MLISASDLGIPYSYNDALKPSEASKWRLAICDELRSLEDNKTWIDSDLPPGKEAIDCRWVFAHRPSHLSDTLRYKARLVVKGYLQTPGVDYTETLRGTRV